VATESISTSESSAATPVVVVFEVTAADKLLLAGVKAFVSFSIMLTRERFTAHAAHERTLVGMGAQMRA
jgi:hypothetical protein